MEPCLFHWRFAAGIDRPAVAQTCGARFALCCLAGSDNTIIAVDIEHADCLHCAYPHEELDFQEYTGSSPHYCNLRYLPGGKLFTFCTAALHVLSSGPSKNDVTQK